MLKLKKTSQLIVLLIALLNLSLARHYALHNTEKKNVKIDPELPSYKSEYHECYIMIQETKRIGGQCVKIRDNFQGCVAGTLMDPFHLDCL